MEISAEDLRLTRNHLDLTQAELAERLDVSPRTIVNWETSGVPARRVPRVEKLIGGAIREALDLEASFQSFKETLPPEEVQNRWAEEGSAAQEAEPAKPAGFPEPGLHPEARRAHLLMPFSDTDLLNELRSRASRRGDRASSWNAERFERYQEFINPKWVELAAKEGDPDEDPDYSKMSEQGAYDLAAYKGDENIAHDDLPHEP
ncbi:helix-turn-helix transcriptional regulator [Arthrobacter sp. KNU-44]|uniref:helix-turn-helix transcriptional regulator n=1 Tax=Arthrobacter sp. KNU-44 TaxID=3450744 RepID=UPI003F438AB3